MSVKQILSGIAVAACAAVMVHAQATKMAPSPDGRAQIELGGKYDEKNNYSGGKWIEITYSRPILRGRNLFAGGPNYGKDLNATAPVWRAGANISTRLRTEAPLTIGGKAVPAGEYSVFIDLKENNWTLILSNWGAKKSGDSKEPDALWGSYGYTPAKDVIRVPMKLSKNSMSIEQLTWGFANVTGTKGDIVLMWDKEIASVPFTLG